jgi:hypothetical protein
MTFNAEAADDGITGHAFVPNLLLRHCHHFTRVSCEVSPLDKEFDVILPLWWMKLHHPIGLLGDPSKIHFSSDDCKRCTLKNCQPGTTRVLALLWRSPKNGRRRMSLIRS